MIVVEGFSGVEPLLLGFGFETKSLVSAFRPDSLLLRNIELMDGCTVVQNHGFSRS